MKEIVLNGKKNGMAVLLLTIVLQIASIAAIIGGIAVGPLLVVLGLLVCGLVVLVFSTFLPQLMG